ncbi:MAG TPA: antibiotic biosynthesis monooxygenase family protein [Desulfotignum sp.]|nr:antibiotic biosynthesis monooxygenase family protein [Desulfotignum sp.]
MSVCVIIKRKFDDKDVASKIAPLIVRLRSQSSIQPGFITDQAFAALDTKGEYLVVSMWDTIEDWNNWMHSALRQPIQREIDELTIEKTEYRYYEPVVGGIIPKFEAVL